jgi:hypothetical protein
MWGFINFGAKLASRYLLPRRWTKYLFLAGALLFFILTALFVDAKLYVTAMVAGIFALACLIVLSVQFVQASREKREYARQQAEAEAQRAAKAQARGQKIEKVRATVTEAAIGLTGSAAGLTRTSAAGLADVAKKGIGSARDRLDAWRSKPGAE